MSKRRRASPSTPVSSRRLSRRGWRVLAAVAAALAVGGVAFLVRQLTPRARIELPPPNDTLPATHVARASFVGSESCVSCHTTQYAQWQESAHGRAGGTARRARVLAAFDGRPLRFLDAVVLPRVLANGAYVFDIRENGRSARILTVDGVIGGGHMEGGGTQGFVTKQSDGTYRFLPFDYSRHAAKWFCNTNSRVDKGWVPITPSLPLAACGDWTPTRVLGDLPRYANCQGCHGSQLDVTLDTTAHQYATRFTSLSINCESCHGPGQRHVALARSSDGSIGSSADIGMRALATLDKDQSLGVCAQCHASKDQVREGYQPGDSLERYYSLSFPLLGEPPLTADGRTRTFAYQEGHRYSDCYLNGGMRCTDCHDPHSQRYRDVNGSPLSGRFDDRQCTSCHASLAEPMAASEHTRHSAASSGSRCVSCHMPYLQHPEIGSRIPYARADHTIPLPRPAADSALGIMPACTQCHRDRSIAALDAQTTRWWGALKPRRTIVREQMRAMPLEGAAAGAALLSGDGAHPLAQFAGLARLLDRYLAGDSSVLDATSLRRLRTLAERTLVDRDSRALALATLHLARGDERETRGLLARVLQREGAAAGGLRDRWAVALGYSGDRLMAAGHREQAIEAYSRGLEIRPDNARLLLGRANAERAANRLAEAIADYRRSYASNPRSALTLVNQGIAEAAAGDTAAAVVSWERAGALDPGEPLGHFNLGNVYLGRGQAREAIAAYQRALARDGSMAPAYFNLSRAQVAAGDLPAALAALRAGLRFDSSDVAARQFAQELGRHLAPSNP